MSVRFRLYPTPEQHEVLLGHCAHARYVWNLGLEQRLMWRPGRPSTPGFAEQSRQLTEARAAEPWLAAGSIMVQQQALRDLDQAFHNWWGGTHRRPSWRKAGIREGFRIVNMGHQYRTERINRRWAKVYAPKVGWMRFRHSREGYETAKSYRVTYKAGRWHIAFAVVPDPIPAPGNGCIVGLDRGVIVSVATSEGAMLRAPRLRPDEAKRLLRLERKATRQHVRGRPQSNRLRRTRAAIARLRVTESDRRKDWVEQTSTTLARSYDVIRVEDLRISNMTRSARGTVTTPGRNVRQKAGLNRGILSNGWGALVERLEHKAAGRIERVNPAYTSQTCSVCGTVDAKARESQAVFACRSCGYTGNADVNAAMNIAAGRAVSARGGTNVVSLKREPQLATSA